ncbi:MAG: ABC transporter substrate-binding protein [Phycisphaeraceae bacterium]|nr:ABC transporter substrate-binding protein [Phycisphaerae bacterium]MBX3393099.1 ABC transporter substrate-binding protein [Phycisphaeraceae bacterium]
MSAIQLIARAAAVVMVGLSLVGCGKSEGGAGGGSGGGGKGAAGASNTNDQGTGDIVIGHYASLTGAEATFGISTDNGIKMAVAERNQAGGVRGRPIRLITYDNQGKPQESQTVVTRLIESDRVVAVLGEVASSRSLAGAPICQRKGVPMVSPSSTNPDVTSVGDMISRVCFIDPFQGLVGAKFARENLGFTRGATLYNRAQAYSAGLNSNFVEAFRTLGGQVLTEQAYSDGDNDFSAQLTAIRERSPEFIYLPGYYTEVVNIARQARRLGIDIPLIGGDGWDSEELKNAGDSLNNSYFSNHYSHEDTRPEVQDFVRRYREVYQKIPDGLAALGYDAARLLFDAMERAESLHGRDLASSINSTTNFAGVTGMISIDANRNPTKDAVILEVVNGQPKYKATVRP